MIHGKVTLSLRVRITHNFLKSLMDTQQKSQSNVRVYDHTCKPAMSILYANYVLQDSQNFPSFYMFTFFMKENALNHRKHLYKLINFTTLLTVADAVFPILIVVDLNTDYADIRIMPVY